MLVKIEYHDSDSLTVEEVVRQAQHNYGKNTKIVVSADSPAPHDLIYFAIQAIITGRQLQLFFDNRETYPHDMGLLRAEVLSKIVELLDTVIIDNEQRVT